MGRGREGSWARPGRRELLPATRNSLMTVGPCTASNCILVNLDGTPESMGKLMLALRTIDRKVAVVCSGNTRKELLEYARSLEDCCGSMCQVTRGEPVKWRVVLDTDAPAELKALPDASSHESVGRDPENHVRAFVDGWRDEEDAGETPNWLDRGVVVCDAAGEENVLCDLQECETCERFQSIAAEHGVYFD